MSDNSVFGKILFLIENNLNEELTLDKIAEELHYSKYYISRVFHKETNSTIYQYIKNRRMTEAARKLVETDEAIVEIAYEAGYNSQQAFTLAFRQVYLCTPDFYRKKGLFYPKQESMLLKYAVSKLNFTSITDFVQGGMAA